MKAKFGFGPQGAGRGCLRGLCLLILLAIVPACSYGKTYSAPGGGGAGTLMSDGFFPFPGGNWTTPTTTGGATFSDPYTGIYYYLDIHAPTPRPTAASFLTRSTAAFNSHQVTIAIDIQTTAQSSLVDVGSVAIENSVIPHAILAEADLDASTLMLTFKIGGTSFTPVALAAGTYYRLTFNVNASDMATWTLGAGTPTTAMAFSPVMVDVALKGNWAMGTPLANPDFLFRNALVTSP